VLRCTLDYRTSAISPEKGLKVAHDLNATLDLLMRNPQITKGEWRTLVE
jgi:hypothetical protein